MPLFICPECKSEIQVDFRPVAGMVYCPKCQKAVSPPKSNDPYQSTSEDIEEESKNGKAD
jgi:uncharacterized Zn finger protein (UPF0148 family)